MVYGVDNIMKTIRSWYQYITEDEDATYRDMIESFYYDMSTSYCNNDNVTQDDILQSEDTQNNVIDEVMIEDDYMGDEVTSYVQSPSISQYRCYASATTSRVYPRLN